MTAGADSEMPHEPFAAGLLQVTRYPLTWIQAVPGTVFTVVDSGGYGDDAVPPGEYRATSDDGGNPLYGHVTAVSHEHGHTRLTLDPGGGDFTVVLSSNAQVHTDRDITTTQLGKVDAQQVIRDLAAIVEYVGGGLDQVFYSTDASRAGQLLLTARIGDHDGSAVPTRRFEVTVREIV